MVGFERVQAQAQPRLQKIRDAAHYRALQIAELWDDHSDEDTVADLMRASRRVLVVVLAGFGLIIVALLLRSWSPTTHVSPVGSELPGATAANDTLLGSPEADVIRAAQGDDLVVGGAGDDRIEGGPGNDTIHGGPGNDTIWAGRGRDVVFGGAGDDTLYATALDQGDRLVCGPGKDVAYVTMVNGRIADRAIGCEQIKITTYSVPKR